MAVADGDTITILDSANTQHRIRLAAIDAPESHQAFGEQSRQSLSGMIFGKDVRVSYQKIDQYGRIVGQVLASSLQQPVLIVRSRYARSGQPPVTFDGRIKIIEEIRA